MHSSDAPMRMSIEPDEITVDFGDASLAGDGLDEIEDLYDCTRDDGSEMLNQKRDKVICFGKFEEGIHFNNLVKGDLIGEGSFGKVLFFSCLFV